MRSAAGEGEAQVPLRLIEGFVRVLTEFLSHTQESVCVVYGNRIRSGKIPDPKLVERLHETERTSLVIVRSHVDAKTLDGVLSEASANGSAEIVICSRATVPLIVEQAKRGAGMGLGKAISADPTYCYVTVIQDHPGRTDCIEVTWECGPRAAKQFVEVANFLVKADLESASMQG